MSYTPTDNISTINVNAKQKKINKLKYLFSGLVILACLSLIGVLIYVSFFKCKDSGKECEETDDCCKNNICDDNNKCCIDVDKECKNNSDCCSNKCENDICVKECKKYNNNCTKNLDCCDDLVCNEGKCKNKCNNLNESCNMSENNCCDNLVCNEGKCENKCNKLGESCNMSENNCCYDLKCDEGTCVKCENLNCNDNDDCCDYYNCDNNKCIKSELGDGSDLLPNGCPKKAPILLTNMAYHDFGGDNDSYISGDGWLEPHKNKWTCRPGMCAHVVEWFEWDRGQGNPQLDGAAKYASRCCQRETTDPWCRGV